MHRYKQIRTIIRHLHHQIRITMQRQFRAHAYKSLPPVLPEPFDFCARRICTQVAQLEAEREREPRRPRADARAALIIIARRSPRAFQEKV